MCEARGGKFRTDRRIGRLPDLCRQHDAVHSEQFGSGGRHEASGVCRSNGVCSQAAGRIATRSGPGQRRFFLCSQVSKQFSGPQFTVQRGHRDGNLHPGRSALSGVAHGGRLGAFSGAESGVLARERTWPGKTAAGVVFRLPFFGMERYPGSGDSGGRLFQPGAESAELLDGVGAGCSLRAHRQPPGAVCPRRDAMAGCIFYRSWPSAGRGAGCRNALLPGLTIYRSAYLLRG